MTRNSYGDVRKRLNIVVEDKGKIDALREDRELSGAEIERRRELNAEFWRLAKLNESML